MGEKASSADWSLSVHHFGEQAPDVFVLAMMNGKGAQGNWQNCLSTGEYVFIFSYDGGAERATLNLVASFLDREPS
jgi:hypothetical protein